MGWGRFKTFIREYLTFQVLNRLQDDLYTKLNYLNDNKIATSLLAASAAPGKIVKVNSDGVMVTDIDGNATTASNGVPTGMIAYWPVESVPDGWLECNGKAVSRDTYSDLYDAIGDKYGAGDGSTTFNLPELRGEFIRVWSNGRTDEVDGEDVEIDDDRELGSSQDDAFQGHTHSVLASVADAGNVYPLTNGLGMGGRGQSTKYFSGGGQIGEPTTDDTNGTPRTASETRPRNVALMACIYSGKSSTGITSRESTAVVTTSFTIKENSDGDLVCQIKEAN